MSERARAHQGVQFAMMLYMVIERFKQGPDPVRQRFAEKGRMLPEGVRYIDSWIETTGLTCYQVMEGDNRDLIGRWTANWADIVDFEIIPVVTSKDFAEH